MQQPGLDQEQALWAAGYRRVAGVDEAGRGAWAGPVVAAAVILPPDPAVGQALAGVADSKLLSPRQRQQLEPLIMAQAAAVGVGVVPAQRIDAVGIAPATRQAMQAALAALVPPADFLLIDYVWLPLLSTPQAALPKGDSRVLSIAAASIIAKVTRDRLLAELASEYPLYGFERHKGYGTASHQAALLRWGPCPQHRRSFRPVQGWQSSLLATAEDSDRP